jgi:hypothetical protein
MCNSRGCARFVLVFLAVAITGIVGSPTEGRAELGVLVPAYFYPINAGVGGDWGQMATAASKIPVTAIMNPDSGPIPGPANSDYVTAITNLENAGGSVVAYVATWYAGTHDPVKGDLSYVESEINLYISQYGSLIKGFFLDQMTNDSSSADLTYYSTLYSYIKGLPGSHQVIGNPGTSTTEDYLKPGTRGADTLVTYENDGQAQPYASAPPASWVTSYSPDHFANIIYNEPLQNMMADSSLAAQRNVGSIFVTDQGQGGSNPYAQLPSYWDQEVAAIQSLNAVPEPGALTRLASAALFGSVAAAARRLGRKRRKV